MKQKSIVIQASPFVVRISPMGFNRYASEFLRAAKSFQAESSFSPVPYYLYCHSIELGLKAFLLVKNVTMKELKQRDNLGHNLVNVLKKAKALGIDQLVALTPEQESEIAKANKYYSNKGFEYFQVTKAAVGSPDLPDLGKLENIASTLVTGLESLCLNAI